MPHHLYVVMLGNVRYNTHLYCLAVQAGFYSDAVECLTDTQEILVRSSAGTKNVKPVLALRTKKQFQTRLVAGFLVSFLYYSIGFWAFVFWTAPMNMQVLFSFSTLNI